MSDFWIKLSDIVYKGVTYTVFAGTVLAMLIGYIFEKAGELTIWMQAQIADLASPDFQFQVQEFQGVLGLANHFFPLGEAWAMMLATIPYYAFFVAFRFLKQFIPTLSN